MASPSLLRASKRPGFICARCAFRASNAFTKTTRRWISEKYLAKMAEAEIAWGEKASRIRSGKEKSMLTILEERGLIHDFTGKRKDVDRMMTDRRLGAYVGIDPTAASLHVGHMTPLMSLFWMHVHGYHTVSLLGGATSKIGDPTGRLTTREKEHSSVGTAYMVNMHDQLKQMWLNVESYGRIYGYQWEWAWHRELINNNAWWNKLPMLDVLKILGPGMRLGSMLARETVKNKMSKGDGMSFAEFTYPIMQAWDWWYMFHTKGIQMQIGGSDQFGNITAGVDAVKYISTHHPDPNVRSEATAIGEPFGFTVPLLTTSSGQKFGKSAGNAIWLDKEMTSTFELYKYFLGTSDADVGKYLKMFTFMPIDKIETLVKEHMESPHQRKAQHKLAREFVQLVHGEAEAKLAETQHRLLFQSPAADLFPEEIADGAEIKPLPAAVKEAPELHVTLPRHVIYQKNVGKILHSIDLAKSPTAAHQLVALGGVYIASPYHPKQEPTNDGFVSWSKIQKWLPEDIRKFLIHGDLLLFRRSKSLVKIVKVVSDEDFVLAGRDFPGMTREWRIGVMEAIKVRATLSDEERQNITKLIDEDQSSLKAELLAEEEKDKKDKEDKKSQKDQKDETDQQDQKAKNDKKSKKPSISKDRKSKKPSMSSPEARSGRESWKTGDRSYEAERSPIARTSRGSQKG